MAITAVLLTIIFVPFQRANAFTVTIDLDNTVSQSPTGEPFEIVIEVEAGELISIDEITLILDNGAPSVALTRFDSSGNRLDGSLGIVVNNKLTISAFSDSGYAYGYGLVSYGVTGPTGYSYSITSTNDFIAGNNIGYSYAVGNLVTGLIGPGEITISGKLRTANLAPGSHTLDVSINTGAGVDPDELTTNTFNFTVEEDDSVVVTEEAVNAGATAAEIVATDSDGDEIELKFNFGAATTTNGNVVVTAQSVDDFINAHSEEQLEAQGLTLSGDRLMFITDDDDNVYIAVGFIMDIDLSALGLPPGTLVTVEMEYDDTGLSRFEENRVRLMHQLDSSEWEALTNDNPDINDGEEVDIENNIVYGTTDDFSLFAPAVREAISTGGDEDEDGGSGGRGGGGRGGGSVVITWPTVETKDDAYFLEHPLERIQVANSAFINAGGVMIDTAQVGQQVSISSEFTNYQGKEQRYAYIVQVLNEDDEVVSLAWQQGTLGSGSTTTVSTLWTPEAAGNYTIKIFVWNSISTTPEPLSEVTVRTISVS